MTRVRLTDGRVGTVVRPGEPDDGAPTYWVRPDGQPSWRPLVLVGVAGGPMIAEVLE